MKEIGESSKGKKVEISNKKMAYLQRENAKLITVNKL